MSNHHTMETPTTRLEGEIYPEFLEETSYRIYDHRIVMVTKTQWSQRRRYLEMVDRITHPEVFFVVLFRIPEDEEDLENVDIADCGLPLRIILICEGSTRRFKDPPILWGALIIFNGILSFATLNRRLKKEELIFYEFACLYDHELYTVRHTCPFYGGPRFFTEKILASVMMGSLEDETIITHRESQTFDHWKMMRHRTAAAKKTS